MHSTTGVLVLRRRLTSLLSATLAAALLVGCSDDGVQPIEPDPGASEQPEADAPDEEPVDDEPAEDEPDPFAVPDEIDEAYVEAVLDEIFARSSDVLRDVLEREPDPTAFITEDQSRALLALFDGPFERQRHNRISDYVASERDREGLLPANEIGPQGFEVESVERDDDGCITAVGWYDTTQTATDPLPRDVFTGVVLLQDEPGVRFSNPTGWKVWDARPLLSGGEPVPLEDIIGSDLSEVLDQTCGREASS